MLALTKPRYRLAEAAELLGIARSRIYERIRERRLNTIHDGRTAFITAEELLRYSAEPQPLHERFQKAPAEKRAKQSARRRGVRRA